MNTAGDLFREYLALRKVYGPRLEECRTAFAELAQRSLTDVNISRADQLGMDNSSARSTREATAIGAYLQQLHEAEPSIAQLESLLDGLELSNEVRAKFRAYRADLEHLLDNGPRLSP